MCVFGPFIFKIDGKKRDFFIYFSIMDKLETVLACQSGSLFIDTKMINFETRI